MKMMIIIVMLSLHLMVPSVLTAPYAGTEKDCFRMYPNKMLNTDREKILLSIKVEQCQERCLHEFKFLCLSFDYIAEESVCVLSPESSYTAPHMLKTSQKTDHYERMLDCEHYHLPEAELKKLRQPQPDNNVKLHAEESVLGSNIDVALGPPQQETMEQMPDLVDIDHVKDTVEGNDTSEQAVVLLVALLGHRKHQNEGIKARHNRTAHHQPEERHGSRVELSAKDRHVSVEHMVSSQADTELAPSLLQKFIQSINHKSLRESHADSHGTEQHASHAAPHSGKSRERHTHQSKTEDPPMHGLHSQTKDSKSRHAREAHHADSALGANRHQKHETAKERYIREHAINNDHLTAAQQDELNRALHEEKHGRKRHSHEEEKLMKAHKEEIMRVQHDETHHSKNKERERKHKHGLNEEHLKSAHDEELLRVTHDENQHNKHYRAKHGKDQHKFNEDHLKSAKEEELLRVTDEEKIHKKHSGAKHKKHYRVKEDHLESARQEELSRVTHEEKHHERRLKAKHKHGLNEDHLQSAQEEDLQRVTHEEKLHKKHTKSKHKHGLNEDHLKSAHAEELQRVTNEEKLHSKHRSPKSKHAFNEDHLKSAQEEELLRVTHEEKHHNKHMGSKQKHGLNEDHLKSAEEEELLRVAHDEKHHSHRQKKQHKEHTKSEEMVAQDMHTEKRKSRATQHKVSHVEHGTDEEKDKRRDKHENCNTKSKRHALDEQHLDNAVKEEVMRIKHDEKHHAAEDVSHKRSKRQPHNINEDHLKKAHQEELLRFKHEERRDASAHKTGHDDHLASAGHEDLLRVQDDEIRASMLAAGKGRREHIPFDEQHIEKAEREELARVQHDERHHVRKHLHENLSVKDTHTDQLRFGEDQQDHEKNHVQSRRSDVQQEHLDLAHHEELLRMRMDETLLDEEERRLREAAAEEMSGSGADSQPIGSGDELDEQGSGSGNWHWGPKEEFSEDYPINKVASTRQVAEESDVWDTHAD